MCRLELFCGDQWTDQTISLYPTVLSVKTIEICSQLAKYYFIFESFGWRATTWKMMDERLNYAVINDTWE